MYCYEKKIIISIIIIVMGVVGGTFYGYITNKVGEIPLEIKNPLIISYYADTDMSEKIDVCIPAEMSSKLKVSSQNVDNALVYTFRHKKSDEILFMISAYANDANKESIKGEEIAKTEKYTYVWLQSVNDNKHIVDETIREEFNTMAKYYTTIKKLIKITKGN